MAKKFSNNKVLLGIDYQNASSSDFQNARIAALLEPVFQELTKSQKEPIELYEPIAQQLLSPLVYIVI